MCAAHIEDCSATISPDGNRREPTELSLCKNLERNMASQKLALLFVAFVGFTAPAFAQGAGGGSGGAAATGGTAAGSATTGGASIAPGSEMTTGSARGSMTQPGSGDPQTCENADGSIGKSGSVGTSLNGKPIGSPGSGLGSPEDSIGPTRTR
jgi:hypothetical protein